MAELVKYVIYGCIAGVMSSIMLTARGNDSDNQQRMRAIRDWCKDKRIPPEMRYEVREGPLVGSVLTVIVAAVFRAVSQTTFRCRLQILRYESMVASKQAQIDPSEILSLMPPSMRDDVTKELYHDFLSRVPLFRGLSSEVPRHQQPATLLHALSLASTALRLCATYAAAF